MFRTCISAVMAASVLVSPLPASAESKRDPKIAEDLQPVELRCPEDDTRTEVKELTVFLKNRYMDEYMYYVYFRNGTPSEAGIRLKRRHEYVPRWLHLAKDGPEGFSPEDTAFVKKTLQDAEPLMAAGCRVPKEQRLQYSETLKLNLIKVNSEAIADPDHP